MNSKKTGEFIAEMRKRKNMTQKDLAKRIFVSDKAVSRWETGKGYPEVETLPLLSKALDVSINEILKGEPDADKSNDEIEKNLAALCDSANKNQYKKNLEIAICIAFFTCGVIISGLSLGACIFTAVAMLLAIALLIYNYRKYSRQNLGNKIMLFCEIIGLLALVLSYCVVYFKFSQPHTVNFIFLLCSLIFALPIAVDLIINELH